MNSELKNLFETDKPTLYKKALFHLRQAGDLSQTPEKLLKSYGFDEEQVALIVAETKVDSPILFER